MFIQNILEYNSDNISRDIPNNIRNYVLDKFKTKDNFFKSPLNNYIKNIMNSNGVTELTILSYLIPIPIIVYDNFSNLISKFCDILLSFSYISCNWFFSE